jgi:hypothetical protein
LAELEGAAREVRSALLWEREAAAKRDVLVVAALRQGVSSEEIVTVTGLTAEEIREASR